MKDIEAILNSADGITPADPTPFFTTRTQARLDVALDKKTMPWLFAAKRPVWVAAVLLVCLVANVVIIKSATTNSIDNNSKTTEVNGMASEFNFISGYSY